MTMLPIRRTLASTSTAAVLRAALLTLFLMGTVGTTAELLLLGHFEDPWQLVPLALLGAGLLALAWFAAARTAGPIRLFRALMVLDIGSGVAGILLHYRGNVEFELEMYPGRAGLELFRESMTGAFPALAPGAMVLFGLIGLAWTFRHPAIPDPQRTLSKEQ